MTSSINSERPQPYVGVSGVISPEIQHQLEASAEEVGLFKTGRQLGLGVKAVHTTQWLDVENRYGREWYPVGENEFRGALDGRDHNATSPDTLPVALTYIDSKFVTDADYRRQFVRRIVERGGPWLQAIQFDLLPWHNDNAMLHFLEELSEEYGLTTLLQCHKDAMDELKPKGVARRLGHYVRFIDYILFDSSHGTGKRLDVTSLDHFLEEADSKLDVKVGLAVAGGLSADVVRDDLPQLLRKYPNLSWDAEGQLHPIDELGKRPLDMQAAEDYLRASAEVISAAQVG